MLDRYDENLILSYLEGELDAQASAQFEALLAQDEPMRLLVEQLANDRVMLRSVPAHEAPASIMANVQAALEQQMLLDVRAQGPASTNSPVAYRFRAWHRWAGAIAAVVALGAGLTWHFDPFGWSRPTQPIGEIASNTHVNKTPPELPEVFADQDAARTRNEKVEKTDLEMAAKTKDVVATPAVPLVTTNKAGESDKIAMSGAAAAIGSSDAQGGAAPGGKGTIAMALAQESGAAPADGVVGNGDAKRDAGQQAAAAKGSQPTFQIELQTVSAVDTRQLVFAWADDNDAVDASRADLRRRAAFFGEASEAQRRNAERAKLSDSSAQSDPKKEAAKDRAAEPGSEDGRGGGAPMAAKSTPSPAVADAAPAAATLGAADENKTAKVEADAAHDRKAREAAKGAPESALAEGALAGGAPPAAAIAAAPLESKEKASASTRQEITLLVPADRVDSLVEHLESTTGQSLIVVREGDQTLLLSPQVANQRALKRAQDETRKSVAEQADKIASSLPAEKSATAGPAGDEAVIPVAPTATAPAAPAPPPAPATEPPPKAEVPAVPKSAVAPGAAPAKPAITAAPASKPEAERRPEAKKQGAKDVKQVLVRIVIVEASK